jgi:hypothetical protein
MLPDIQRPLGSLLGILQLNARIRWRTRQEPPDAFFLFAGTARESWGVGRGGIEEVCDLGFEIRVDWPQRGVETKPP